MGVQQGGSTTESYTYDKVGNRLSSITSAVNQYNSSNELTSDATFTYGYDNNGNMTSKTDASAATTGYTWDFENRQTSVALPGTGGTVSFKYDPFGRRVQKNSSSGTTVYAYDGASIADEYDFPLSLPFAFCASAHGAAARTSAKSVLHPGDGNNCSSVRFYGFAENCFHVSCIGQARRNGLDIFLDFHATSCGKPSASRAKFVRRTDERDLATSHLVANRDVSLAEVLDRPLTPRAHEEVIQSGADY